MPKSSSWALGAADGGLVAAGTCCLACGGCRTAGGVTPRPLPLMARDRREREGGKPGSACCCRNNRGSSLSHCVLCKRSSPKRFVKRWQRSRENQSMSCITSFPLAIDFTNFYARAHSKRDLCLSPGYPQKGKWGKNPTSLTKYLPRRTGKCVVTLPRAGRFCA